MATINAFTLQDIAYSGEAPLAVAHGSATLAAAAINDKVRLSKVFAGTKVMDVKLVNAALGASTTVKLGFEYANGEAGSNDAAFIPATSTVSAGAIRSNAAPVFLDYDAYITATVGGGAATGKIDVVLTYEPRGK